MIRAKWFITERGKVNWSKIFVWSVFAFFVAWVLLIVAAQNSYGFGPFVVYPDIPHEGRYVFAGLVQLLTFTWSFMFVLKILHKAEVSFLRVIHWPATMQLNADIRSLQIGRFASIGSLTFLVGVVSYTIIYVSTTDEAVHTAPVAPVVLQFIIYMSVILPYLMPVLVPLWTYRRENLVLLYECLRSVFILPCVRHVPVTLRHVLLADSLTSATLLVWDLCYSICHFTTTSWTETRVRGSDGSLDTVDVCSTGVARGVRVGIYMLPFVIRLAQCLHLYAASRATRHALNAGKYMSAIAVVITSAAQSWAAARGLEAVRTLWIFSLVVKSIYCFAWDIRMDWGLGHRALLRHTLSFERWYYYIAMLTNLFGRVSWALAISPNFCGESCTLTLSLIEIIRRAQWLVYRVEFEYVLQQTTPRDRTALVLPNTLSGLQDQMEVSTDHSARPYEHITHDIDLSPENSDSALPAADLDTSLTDEDDNDDEQLIRTTPTP